MKQSNAPILGGNTSKRIMALGVQAREPRYDRFAQPDNLNISAIPATWPPQQEQQRVSRKPKRPLPPSSLPPQSPFWRSIHHENAKAKKCRQKQGAEVRCGDAAMHSLDCRQYLGVAGRPLFPPSSLEPILSIHVCVSVRACVCVSVRACECVRECVLLVEKTSGGQQCCTTHPTVELVAAKHKPRCLIHPHRDIESFVAHVVVNGWTGIPLTE